MGYASWSPKNTNCDIRQLKGDKGLWYNKIRENGATGKSICQNTSTDKEKMWLIWLWPPTSTVFNIQEDMYELSKTNHFKLVCRSNNGRRGTVHDIKQKVTNDNQIDMVDINFISFNSKQSIIVAKLKTSSNQNCTIIPYTIDTGSDGNKLPVYIFNILFPRVMTEQFEATKNKSTVLKT